MSKKLLPLLLVLGLVGCSPTPSTSQKEENQPEIKQPVEHKTEHKKEEEKVPEENKEVVNQKEEKPIIKEEKPVINQPIQKEEIKEEELIDPLQLYLQHYNVFSTYSLYHLRKQSVIDPSYDYDYFEYSSTDGQFKFNSSLTGGFDLLWNQDLIAVEFTVIDPNTQEIIHESLITHKSDSMMNLIQNTEKEAIMNSLASPLGIYVDSTIHFHTIYDQLDYTTNYTHTDLISSIDMAGELYNYHLDLYNEGGYPVGSVMIDESNYIEADESTIIEKLTMILY